MRLIPAITILTAILVLMSACSSPEEKASATEAVVPPQTGRLGMRQDLTLEPGPEGWWIVSVSGASPGPGANPDNVAGASGRIDMNGDGVTEIVQARMGGASWSSFTVFTGEGAVAVYGADGAELLMSKTEVHRNWPLLGTWNRDPDAADIGARKIDNIQQWSGLDYAPVTP